MKTYVIDASFVLSFLLPDEEKQEKVDSLFETYAEGNCSFISIPLLPFEVLNGLTSAIKRRRIDRPLAERAVRNFFDLQIALQDVPWETVWDKAQAHGLSIYDAGYVALATSENAELLTLDEEMQAITPP